MSHCDHQAAAEALRGTFIAKGTSVTWPLSSPDLTPTAIYQCGLMKERTYKREPQTLPELKAVVTECVRAATDRECRRVLAKVRRESKSVWPKIGDTPINCSGFQGDAQTVMTNDGYEFPMFMD